MPKYNDFELDIQNETTHYDSIASYSTYIRTPGGYSNHGHPANTQPQHGCNDV